jgi:hypothetical protein
MVSAYLLWTIIAKREAALIFSVFYRFLSFQFCNIIGYLKGVCHVLRANLGVFNFKVHLMVLQSYTEVEDVTVLFHQY